MKNSIILTNQRNMQSINDYDINDNDYREDGLYKKNISYKINLRSDGNLVDEDNPYDDYAFPNIDDLEYYYHQLSGNNYQDEMEYSDYENANNWINYLYSDPVLWENRGLFQNGYVLD